MKKYLSNIYNNYLLQANSILESVIAMAIIAIVITVSIIMTNQVFSTQNSIKKFQLTQKINELQYNTVNKNKYYNEIVNFKGVVISKNVIELDSGLYEINYSYSIGKEIYVIKIISNGK